MKIAVTADCHLTTRELHPQRYRALEDLLSQLIQSEITTLVIAGDLFDGSSQNYAEFEELFSTPRWRSINVLVVPGNHDEKLKPQHFAAENITIVAEPTLTSFAPSGLKFLLLPYLADKTMGEFIASHAHELSEGRWVLVGHGDWIEHFSERNPLEPGVYMPLTKADLKNYRPLKVLLGHIHKPLDHPPVYYIGSPCGLDIRETGRRRYLTLDAVNGTVSANWVATDVIYFNESLLVLPVKDEAAYVRDKLDNMIRSWDLRESEISKARVQLRVRGYCSDKQALLTTIQERLAPFEFYQQGGPDVSGVFIADDPSRAEIAGKVADRVARLDFRSPVGDPTNDQVLLEALHVIYGE